MRSLLRVVGRALLALPFIRLGWDAAREPGPRVNAAASFGLPNPEAAVRLNGGAMVVAGLALACGILPRWAALTLVACLVPTTAAGHAFWKFDEPQQRTGQMIHFLKNVSMVGGLLIEAARDDRSAESAS